MTKQVIINHLTTSTAIIAWTQLKTVYSSTMKLKATILAIKDTPKLDIHLGVTLGSHTSSRQQELPSRNSWRNMVSTWRRARICSQWCAYKRTWWRNKGGRCLTSSWISIVETRMECTNLALRCKSLRIANTQQVSAQVTKGHRISIRPDKHLMEEARTLDRGLLVRWEGHSPLEETWPANSLYTSMT